MKQYRSNFAVALQQFWAGARGILYREGESPSLTERPPNQPNPPALRPGWLRIPSTHTCPSGAIPSLRPPHLGLEADAVLEGVLVVQGDPQVVPIVHKVVYLVLLGMVTRGGPAPPEAAAAVAGRGWRDPGEGRRELGATARGGGASGGAPWPRGGRGSRDSERRRGPGCSGRRGCGRRERRCGRAIPTGEEGGGGGGGSWRRDDRAGGGEQWARGPRRDWARHWPGSSGADSPGQGRKGGSGSGAGRLSRRRRISRGRAAPPAGWARAGSSRGASRPRPPPGPPPRCPPSR